MNNLQQKLTEQRGFKSNQVNNKESDKKNQGT